MSVTPTSQEIPQTPGTQELDIPLPPTELPYDDGALETKRHRTAMNIGVKV